MSVVLGAHVQANARAIPLEADEIVINTEWEKGQLSSVQAGLRSLPQGTGGMLLCPIDHPLISANLAGELIEKFYATGAPVVVPVYEGRRGPPGILSPGVYAELVAPPPDVGA